ncbi:MAG: Ran-binding zinc finger domain-containing protein [Bdellovibrionales bacterium]
MILKCLKQFSCLAIFVTLFSHNASVAQEINPERQAQIQAVLKRLQKEQSQIKRIVLMDQAKTYVIDLPVNIVKGSPKNLVACAKGMIGAAVDTARELCYSLFDTAVATVTGAKILFGSAKAAHDAKVYIPKSGLYQAVKEQGWGATVKEIPRAVFESTLNELLSGDPERAGRFITNTAILLAPAPKTISSVSSALKSASQSTMTINAQGALAFAGASSYAVSAEGLASIANAMVQESAAMGALSSVMMQSGSRQIWGFWDCPSCGTKKISARPAQGETNASCTNCGKGKPAGTKHYLDDGPRDSKGRIIDDTNDVRGEAEKKVANGGKDWSCTSCGTSNKAIHHKCGSCGAPHTKERPKVRADSTSPERSLTPSGLTKTQMLVGGAGVAAVAGGAYFLFKTSIVQGQLVSKSWSHTEALLEFKSVTRTAWEDQIHESSPIMPVNGRGEHPGAFNVHGCHQAQRSTVQVACGTEIHTIKGTCTYADNGNGSFTESCAPDTTEIQTKYCDEPVYDTKCSYETYVWSAVNSRTVSGNEQDHRPLPWPQSFHPGANQKTEKTSSYKVKIEYVYRDKKHSYDLDLFAEDLFHDYQINEAFELEVSRAHVGKVTRLKDSNVTGAVTPTGSKGQR